MKKNPLAMLLVAKAMKKKESDEPEMDSEASADEPSEEVAVGEDILAAIKNEDASALVDAICALMELKKDEPEEDTDSEEI